MFQRVRDSKYQHPRSLRKVLHSELTHNHDPRSRSSRPEHTSARADTSPATVRPLGGHDRSPEDTSILRSKAEANYIRGGTKGKTKTEDTGTQSNFRVSLHFSFGFENKPLVLYITYITPRSHSATLRVRSVLHSFESMRCGEWWFSPDKS